MGDISRITFKGAVADGDFLRGVDSGHPNHIFSIVFYTDNTYRTPVAKAGMSGTVTFTLSETGEEFGGMTNGTVTLGAAMYDRPFASGSYNTASAVFDSVVGATHYKILLVSYKG